MRKTSLVQGACTEPIPSDVQMFDTPPEYANKPGACSIVTSNVILFYTTGMSLWLSNLVLTSPPKGVNMNIGLLAWDSSVWMSDMVIAGSELQGVWTIDSSISFIGQSLSVLISSKNI